MIKDHKNRLYSLISCSKTHTYMECVETGSKIQVANDQFSLLGFEVA